jgi:hypothetical protein
MNKLVSASRLFLKRNASTILTCVGAAGVVVTSVLAVKATPTAIELLKEAEQEKGEKLTKLEVVKIAGPAYIPAAITGASSIACIFGANVLNKRQQAALMSAYALIDNSYKEYKGTVEELYGENANAKVREAIAKAKYEDEKAKKEAESEEDDGKQLFYDQFSGRYFRSTIEDVQRAEYRLNRTLMMRDYVYLNEFYEDLDLEPLEQGYSYGWSRGANLARYWQDWVDFTHEKVVHDDGLECQIIVMQGEPVLDFMEYS